MSAGQKVEDFNVLLGRRLSKGAPFGGEIRIPWLILALKMSPLTALFTTLFTTRFHREIRPLLAGAKLGASGHILGLAVRER